MSRIKQRLAIAFATAALSGTAFIAEAMAECKMVKEDPNCWGDTCVMKQVCTPDPAWTYQQKKFPPIGSQSGYPYYEKQKQ